MFGIFENKKINQQLYQRNLELAVKNKTLSLLEKLYHTSTLTLTPEEMAKAITDVIWHDLNLECAGILRFKKKSDVLHPLAFSGSHRFIQALAQGANLEETSIAAVSQKAFLQQILQGRVQYTTQALDDVWGATIDRDQLLRLQRKSNIKTILLCSLVIGKEVLGVLVLGFNRDYETLNAFEKESIKNFIDPIALLLYKAYLYHNIKKAYAVEKEAKEELEKIDRFKDQFLMTTQHNLRTPLTSMMGYSDLILNGTFGKQSKKTVEIIKKFQMLTQSMIKMVNDFLDAAQFQLGKSVVILKPGVQLWPLLDELMNELKFKADSKNITLDLQKSSKSITISADREKLKAALFNIIDNSVKYTENGGVTIKVQISNFKVQIVVKDTGIGIPVDKVKTLFENMFERTEQAKKVSSVGSGIGLYLSGQIIKAHNGKCWAESAGEGKGSTFYIELPKI